MALLAPHNSFDTDNAEKPRKRGRPKGSRNKLAQRFFEDLYEAWEEQGESAIARAAFHDPVAFVSIVARLMPQKLEITQPTDGISDERLAEMLDYAERMAALRDSAAAGDQARVIEGRAHVLSDENGVAAEVNGMGGGGPDAGYLLGGEKTAHTIAAAPAETAPSPHKHNGLSNPLSPPYSLSATTPLPHPVGKPHPTPDHLVEQRNRNRLSDIARNDPIDPASLF
jgi:hypothetical protein